MKKNIVKLNESQLRKIVAESVKRVLNEKKTFDNVYNTPDFMFADEDEHVREETTWKDYVNDVNELYNLTESLENSVKYFIQHYGGTEIEKYSLYKELFDLNHSLEDVLHTLYLTKQHI